MQKSRRTQSVTIKLAAVLGLLATGACGWPPGPSSPSVDVGFVVSGSSVEGTHQGGLPHALTSGVLVWAEGRAPMLTSPMQIPGEDRSLAFLVVIDPPADEAADVLGDGFSGEAGSAASDKSGASASGGFRLGDLRFANEVRYHREPGSEDPWQLELRLEFGTHPGLAPVDQGVDIEKGRVFYVNSSDPNPVLLQLDIELPRGFDEGLGPDEYYALLEPVLAQLP